jgi:hypothetical protein
MLDELARLHGEPEPPRVSDPFEQIPWENVAYLAGDERRAAAFDSLRKRVGLTAPKILAASPAALHASALRRLPPGGPLPVRRAERVGDTYTSSHGIDPSANRTLKRLPAIPLE